MIKAILRRGIRKFADRYNYDTDYMNYVVEHSTSAGVRLSFLPVYGQFSGPKKAKGVWVGAMLGSTLEGDCGPCVQLVVDMATEHGVPAQPLRLCLQGEPEAAGDIGLGFRFAQATIADDVELIDLRAEIEKRFGTAAVVAASFAASSGRIYPVLKRGLGFGQTCTKVCVADVQVQVHNTA